MKLLPLFLLFFFILLTHAQRRTTAKATTESETPKPVSRGRGRSRFTSSPEYKKNAEISSTTESTSRKTVTSRRRIVENIEQKFPTRASSSTSSPQVHKNVGRRTPSISDTADKIFLNNVDKNVVRKAPSTLFQPNERKNFRTRPKNSYEVEEIIKDDMDQFRKSKKPRVLTETNFRATNFPKRTVTEKTVTSEPTPQVIGNTNLVEEQPIDTTLKPESDTSIDTLTESELKEEIPKTIPLSSTSKPTETPRAQGNRRRIANRVSEQVTPAPTRVRTRKRPTQAPDFYFQAVSTSVPSSNFRRRVDTLFSSIEPKKGPSVFNAESGLSESRSRTGRKIETPPEKITIDIPTRSRRLTTTPRNIKSSRNGRFRSREMPVIDEQKLEVLPLFEEEPKLISNRRSRKNDNLDSRKSKIDIEDRSRNKVAFKEKQRSRGPPAEYIETSATETDMKFTPSVAVNITESSPLRYKTEVKESVTSEINEVTSRRKIPRKKITIINATRQKMVPTFRGSKKAEVKVSRKQNSEEVDDSDNYPEAFKALIKAKKGDKEINIPISAYSTVSSIVSSSTPSTTTYKLITKEINENENELKSKTSTLPSTSSRWSRSRYTPSSSTKSTISTSPSSRISKYHRTYPSRGNSSVPKLEKNVSFKPRTSNNEIEVRKFGRGRTTKQPPETNILATKVPKYVSSTTVKKFDRGKYRGSTTNAPKYIPTIPSVPYVPTVPIVTSHRTTVEPLAYRKSDENGLQVISIDEPVYAIPSDNLVNADFLPMVNGGSTEKPVSIIERIINSITAISTTSPASNTASSTASTTESPSAILKLSSKKSRQTDKTDEKQQQNSLDSVILTTENPTTIIEKILSSLNAIHATDNTKSVQVGTDFNTLSSFTTTPIPSVTKFSTRSLLAHSSTSINPLSILDEITPEEVLQKQTIGRLLDILNGLVVTTSQTTRDFVVVTPKNVNKPEIPTTSTTESILSNEISDSPSTTTISSQAQSSTSQALFSETPTTEAVSSEMPSTVEKTSPTSVPIITTSDETLMTSSTTTESQETSTVSTFPTTSEAGIRTTEGINFFKVLSTLPTFQKFEVSPGSVSVFSANDLSNSVTPEDNISTTTTVNIAGRFNFDNNMVTTTQSTTTEIETTTIELTTEGVTSGPMESSTVNSTQTNGRSGKLLNVVQDPVQNNVDTSTPDYFIFAVLNNNTILRKKPLVEKNSPFFVIGVYPNNTVVKKYLNGTVVPMESIIRVRGFDTRQNPPPLPEITSNQVTSESGSSMDNKIIEMDEQNTIPPKPLSKAIRTDSTPNTAQTSPTAPTTTLSKTETIPTTSLLTTPNKLQNSPTTPTTILSKTETIPTSPILTTSNKPQNSPTTIFPKTETIPTSPLLTTPTTSNTDTLFTSPLSNDIPVARKAPNILTTPTTTFSKTYSIPISTLSTNLPLTTVEISTSTITPITSTTLNSDMVTVESSTLGNDINPTIPTLSELLPEETIEAFNEIINKTEIKNYDTTPNTVAVKERKYTQVLNIQDLLKSRSQETITGRANEYKVNLTTMPTTTTTIPTTESTTKMETTTISTTIPTTKATKGRRFTSTPATPTSTYFPTFLTTLFPNLFETTKAPIISTKAPGVIRISAAPSVTETITIRPTTSAPRTTSAPKTTSAPRSTSAPRTTSAPKTTIRSRTTTTPIPTTTRVTRTRTTTIPTTTKLTTTVIPITTTLQAIRAASTTKRSIPVTDLNTLEVTTTKTIKLKELSNEQRENLKMIARLEQEQAALLQQLSFLTNLGLGPNKGKQPSTKQPSSNSKRKPKSSSATLAERIVALAVERDKQTTNTVESTLPTTTFKPPNSIQDQLAALETSRKPKEVSTLDNVLKQLNGLNIVTTEKIVTTISEDAILNSLLKEQGILPSTPKSLAGIFDETTIRPRSRPRTTTIPPPGPLMRGLNWLLTALGPQPQALPPPTRRPTRKPVKPKKPPVELELLANSPTHVTPVVTAAPSKVANSLSQDDIQKLIRQLEGIQKDPSKGDLDLSKIKSLQNLINLDEGVVVMTNGEHGTTSRRSTTLPTTQSRQPTERQPRKLSTDPPIVSVSNSVEDFDFESTTSRVMRAPIGFRPVPGVDDDDNPNPLVRSNLVTAAVNVTKAISGFLGTALQTVSQGAAASFSSLFGGSTLLGSRFLGSSAG